MTIRCRSARRTAALMAAAASATLACGVLVASARAASGASYGQAPVATGWMRLAHLSPDTPAVDVYLYNFGDPSAQVVLRHVAYGTVSGYLPVKAGEYTVAMRAAGKAAKSPPVLSKDVVVAAGHAYTVAGMGPFAGLRLEVIPDQLSTPPGRALIRVIQASMRQRVVKVSIGGRVAAPALDFASITGYQSVAPGRVTIEVTGQSATATDRVMVRAGTISTLAVLDEHGTLRLVSLLDAAGSSTMPIGGTATGMGGMARPPSPVPLPWLACSGAAVLLALAGLARYRRPSARAARAR